MIGVLEEGGRVVEARASTRRLEVDDPEAPVPQHDVPALEIAVHEDAPLAGEGRREKPPLLFPGSRHRNRAESLDEFAHEVFRFAEERLLVEDTVGEEILASERIGDRRLEIDEDIEDPRIEGRCLGPRGRSQRILEVDVAEILHENDALLRVERVDLRRADAVAREESRDSDV
jgi:hypothetical protein